MSSTERILLAKIREYLHKHSLTGTKRLTVAYSGGPDSTALLHLLVLLKAEYDLHISAVYVDHGIRSLSEREREGNLVIHTAFSLGIPLRCLYIPSGCIEKSGKSEGGTEAAARNVRYRFFEDTLAEEPGEIGILLAHTLDDQIETQVMRFFQGSGVEGLRGIPEKRGALYRPLLSVRKEVLYRFLHQRDIEYSTDSSNAGNDYLRNRVRAELLPIARSIFPGIERALGELSSKMEVYAGDGVSIDLSEEADGGVSFSAEAFARLPERKKEELLYSLWDAHHGGERRRLPHRFVRRQLELSEEKSITGHGIRLSEREGRIFYGSHVVGCKKKRYLKLIEDGRMDLPSGDSVFVDRYENTTGTEDEVSLIVYTSHEYGPCIIRSRRDGDEMETQGGVAKVKELYHKMEIPPEERWRNPVIEDRRGILAVLCVVNPSSSFVGSIAREEPRKGFRYQIREA